jgi:hypothetical protein
MPINLREDVNLISYQDTEDAFALMNIIKIAENDIKNGKVKKVDDVFNDLRKKIEQNG